MVIQAVAEAFAAYSAGRTQTPLRVGVEPPGVNGVLLAMPSALATESVTALGAKIVSVFRGNPARGLPTVTSIYVLSDYETGAPLALMDGGYLTGIRTAAGSAVATRELARIDARTLGVFGTGVQARFHVETIRRVRKLERVLVCGTSAEKANDFVSWVVDTTGLPAVATTAEEASGADIVALCTTSPTPVIKAEHVRPGAHINAVGAFTPTTRELPADLVATAAVYVDTRAGAFSEAGDLLLAAQETDFELERVRGEIGEVLLGKAAGRTPGEASRRGSESKTSSGGSDAEITLYKSVGAAFLDAATARLAFEAAGHQAVGTVYAFDAE